jgi:hypothetical protein
MSRSKLIVPGLAETVPQELQELPAKTARERGWYAGFPIFETIEDIMAAAQKGELAIVNPNKNFSPIGRLRNPELFQRFPPYLLPSARHGLEQVGRLWRAQLQAGNIYAPETVLAVTSLVRSNEAQQDLVRFGKLADPESTHRTGGAFDIDASGYYVQDPEAGLISVVHPDRNRRGMRQVAGILKGEVDRQYDMPEAPSAYDPRLADTLLTVTERLHDSGFINRIVEFGGTANQCIHIAVNPDVHDSDWARL